MSQISRENALRLIRVTIFEFHRDVMIPLNSNIHLYDRERNADAMRLHERFHDFSAAVQDIYSTMSTAMEELEEWDNSKLSQFLNLCRDISELYDLQVFKDMPGSIPDNSPIRYVDPDVDAYNYAQRLAEQNVHILDEIISTANSETEKWRRSLLEPIIDGLNKMDPNGERIIIDEIEKKCRPLPNLIGYQNLIGYPILLRKHYRFFYSRTTEE